MQAGQTKSSWGLWRSRPTKRACGDCHARKVKCDGALKGFPCSNCRSADVLCIVPERRKRRRHADGGETVPPPQSPALAADQSTAALDSGQHLAAGDHGPASASTTFAQPSICDGGNATSDEEDDALCPIAPEEHTGDLELSKQHLVKFFSQDLQNSAPIAWRLAYVGNELSNLNYLTRQRSTNHHVYHYSCSNSYAPRVPKEPCQVPTPSRIPKDAFVLPPRQVSDVLIAAYFEHIHPYLPILDRELFLAAYENPDTSPPLLLLQAVCLAGSHAQTAFGNTQELKVAFFRRTKACFDSRYEEDRMNMVQAAILMTWLSDGGDDVCANAWWWIGLACRAAIGLGMHRDVKPSKMPETDKRTWRRIWWCLVQFDLLVSLYYGRPQTINLDDCDTPQLSIDDFDSSISPMQAQFCMEHAKLCVLVSDFLRTHFSVRALKSQSDPTVTLRVFDHTLADWLISLPADLRQSKRRTNTSQKDPCRPLLHLTYHALLIQVHRRRGGGGTGSSQAVASEQDDDKICADSATTIVQIFEQLSQLSALRKCWFWAPSTIFTAMLQLSGQLECGNAIIALQAQEDFDSGLQSLRRLSRHWLSAASVLMLLRSDSVKARPHGWMPKGQPTHGICSEAIDPCLEGESPSFPVSLDGSHDMQASNVPPGQVAIDGEQNMNWIHLFASGAAAPGEDYMQFQPNRWQDSFSQWQTLFWGDSLASLMPPEGNGKYPIQRAESASYEEHQHQMFLNR